jgi:hypothetical protein
MLSHKDTKSAAVLFVVEEGKRLRVLRCGPFIQKLCSLGADPINFLKPS